jgi:hypothetical protein
MVSEPPTSATTTLIPPNERVKLGADALVGQLVAHGIVANVRSGIFAKRDAIRVFVGLKPGVGESAVDGKK